MTNFFRKFSEYTPESQGKLKTQQEYMNMLYLLRSEKVKELEELEAELKEEEAKYSAMLDLP